MIIHAVLVVEPQEERRVNDIHRERRDAQRPLGRHGCPRLRVCARGTRTLVDHLAWGRNLSSCELICELFLFRND